MTVVIVTGTSRGIGASIANVLLADKSTSIVAVARSEDALTKLKIKYGEERVATVQGDISDSVVAKKIIDTAVQKYGKIDSIIANAGVLDPVQRVEMTKVAEWRRLFDINFFSVVELVALALPHLRETKGNVVFVSSGASTKGYYGWGAYGASKAALNHFATQLVAEEPLISAIAVAPGVVDTQMQDDIRDKFGHNMTPESHKRFTDLKRNQELLDPIVPATIYANLALKGIAKEINGQYLRYSDESLAEYK